MTIALADARHMAEADAKPTRLAFKGADTESGQVIALNADEGIVTAIVSVTGVEDEVADIIEPGAYRETLTKRRPKVCWAHSWERPIGRVLTIEELLPGDRRLPAETKDGQPWPAEAGALVATMQFNMESDAGAEAFKAVKFYSESGECEYSIGYQVPPGRATRDKTGVRHIKSLELYELSVVLFGAHTMTGTLSIKAAAACAAKGLRLHDDPDVDYAAFTVEKKEIQDFSNGVMVAVYPNPEAADQIAAAVAGTDAVVERDDLHVTLAYLGTTDTLDLTAEEIEGIVTDAVEGLAALEGEVGGIGVFPDSGDGAPTWVPVDVPGLSMLREQVVEALGEVVATDHGFTPHMTIGYNLGLVEPVDPIPVRFSDVRVVYGQQDRRIPLGPPTMDEEKSMTETTVDLSIEGKSLDEVARLTAIANLCRIPEVKAEGGADRNQGNAEELREYWVRGEGAAKIRWGTPGDFRRCVRQLSKHMTPENAKGYCANRHKEATGMWPGDRDNKGLADQYDPTLESKTPVPADPGKGFPHMTGTYEERLAAIRSAVNEALRGELVDEATNRYEWDYVSIDATWPDRVVASRVNWSSGDDDRETFAVAYRVDEDGSVHLAEPEQVFLELIAVPVGATGSDDEDDDEVGVADALPIADEVYTLASAFQAATMQTKAGRVLSGANERRLRDAVEGLLNVLRAAGVHIDNGDEPPSRDGALRDSDPRKEVDPAADLESTAPSAQVKGAPTGELLTIDMSELNARLAEYRQIAST